MRVNKIVSFAMPVTTDASTKQITFAEVEGGIQSDFVIFSTAFNRNKAYFQVSDLMRFSTVMEKLMTNFNHDLSLSKGKYLGNKNKWSDMRAEWNNGILEIKATFTSTDPLVVAQKDEITGCSIELLIPDGYVRGQDGSEYYPEYELSGIALLVGMMAGSGNSRMLEMKQFANDGKLTPLSTPLMDETQLEAKLASFKTELVDEMKAALLEAALQFKGENTTETPVVPAEETPTEQPQPEHNESEEKTDDLPVEPNPEEEALKEEEKQVNQALDLAKTAKAFGNKTDLVAESGQIAVNGAEKPKPSYSLFASAKNNY